MWLFSAAYITKKYLPCLSMPPLYSIAITLSNQDIITQQKNKNLWVSLHYNLLPPSSLLVYPVQDTNRGFLWRFYCAVNITTVHNRIHPCCNPRYFQLMAANHHFNNPSNKTINKHIGRQGRHEKIGLTLKAIHQFVHQLFSTTS